MRRKIILAKECVRERERHQWRWEATVSHRDPHIYSSSNLHRRDNSLCYVDFILQILPMHYQLAPITRISRFSPQANKVSVSFIFSGLLIEMITYHAPQQESLCVSMFLFRNSIFIFPVFFLLLLFISSLLNICLFVFPHIYMLFLSFFHTTW
jgi:hypothetical protein